MSSVHRTTLAELVRTQGWRSGVELGVDKGILFGQLLKTNPGLTLVGVDIFPDRERSHRAFDYAREYDARARLVESTTRQASETIADGSIDFVFIDADHSYDAVLDDIACWQPKVRAGGWLGGHDYHARKFPGVVKAVNQVFGGRHHELPGTIWGVWC